MRRRSKIILGLAVLVLHVSTAAAQVLVDKQLQMTGPAISDRQITGVGNPTDSLDAVNQKSFQYSTLVFGIASGIDSLNLSLNPPVNAYSTGMMLNFKATANNTGAVKLNVNGLGPVPLLTPDTLSLFVNYIKTGQIVTVIYQGSWFQLISRTDPGCPAGFVEANSRYCIEVNERTPTTSLTAAANVCYSINARLCNWNEWYYACQKSSLGLQNMTNNWEYMDDTSDHNHTVTAAGNQGCASSTGLGLIGNTTPFAYRCCFSK